MATPIIAPVLNADGVRRSVAVVFGPLSDPDGEVVGRWVSEVVDVVIKIVVPCDVGVSTSATGLALAVELEASGVRVSETVLLVGPLEDDSVGTRLPVAVETICCAACVGVVCVAETNEETLCDVLVPASVWTWK